jgi:hypothetical protein
MKQLTTFFVAWLMTVQAALAFAPNKTNTAESRKYVETVIANYNQFASKADITLLPKDFGAENSKIVKNYMDKNKISSALPIAKLTARGTIEMTLAGQNTVIEINPSLGTISLNGQTLVLKATNSLQNRLDQIEKFLGAPKTAGAFEQLISIIIPAANADCLSKYDAAVDEKMPKREGIYKLHPPGAWTLAIGVLLSWLLIPTGIAILPFVPMYGSIIATPYVNDKDREIRNEEWKVETSNWDLIAIDGALRVAKSGKVPTSGVFGGLSEDGLRFKNLYFHYSELVSKNNGVPLSEEEFLKTLAEGDAKEKFCSAGLIDSAQKLTDTISATKAVDPNVVNKTEAPAAAVVDKSREDIPKDVIPVTVEQKSEIGAGTSK